MEYHLSGLLLVLCGLLAVAAVTRHRENEVAVRDLRAGEEYDHQLCKRLADPSGLPKQHAVWPRLWRTVQDSSGRTLVGMVDGLIVGRVILEAPYRPYCELVNLCVRPDYRGRGVATALVRESIRRARETGFKYMVLQEYHDSAAHGIYEKVGFVNATVGEMQRLIKLLDVPLVSIFLQHHPNATFISEAAPEHGERRWRLLWRVGDDYVALLLQGGSCQGDSDGFQPVVQACEFVRGGVGLVAGVETVPELARGEVADLVVALENCATEKFEGVVRAMLLPDTEVVGEFGASVAQIELEVGESATIRLPIRVHHEFSCDAQRFCSYPSAPFTVEICWEEGSVLLSAAVKVR